jgi:hypothetical protein
MDQALTVPDRYPEARRMLAEHLPSMFDGFKVGWKIGCVERQGSSVHWGKRRRDR